MASSNCLVQHSSKYILCSTEEIHLCRSGIIWVKGFVLHLALDLHLNYYSPSPSEQHHSTSGEHGLYNRAPRVVLATFGVYKQTLFSGLLSWRRIFCVLSDKK